MSKDQMPPAVSVVFEDLFKNVSVLFLRYKYFKQVFASQEAVDLLNYSAPHFFQEVRDIMLENILILICQLTDNAKMGKKENMTLQRLMNVIEDHETGLYEKLGLSTMMDDLERNTKEMRVVRNRTLAHNDYGQRLEPLPKVQVRQINDSLTVMEKILNATSLHFRNANVDCQPFSVQDGEMLILVLQEWAEQIKKTEPWRLGADDET